MPKAKDRKTAIANQSESGLHTGKTKPPTAEFLMLALDMSWRLAIVVLVPVIGSYKLDLILGTSPWLAIIGFLIAMIGVGFVMRQTYNAANQIDLPKVPRDKENE